MSLTTRTHPLTERQRLVWVSHQLRPEIPLYHIVFSFRIQGALDPERFARAFGHVVQTTAALRTVIRTAGEREAAAEVLPYVAPDLAYQDLRAAEESRKTYIDSIIWQPFNLAERLFRSWLLRTGEQEFVWLLSIHHIVTDTISFQLIYDRVMAAYRHPGDPPESPSLGLKAAFDLPPDPESVAYWESRLAGMPSGFQFYGQTDEGHAHPLERFSWQISAGDLPAIDRLKDPEIGLAAHRFNFFAAAYALYLARLGGTDSPVVAMVYHGRRRPGMWNQPGLFVQMLPLCIPITKDDSIPDLMRKAQDAAVPAIRHSRVTVANSRQRHFMHASLNLQIARFEAFCGMPVKTTWHASGWNEHSLVFNIHMFSDDRLQMSLDISKTLLGPAEREDAAGRFHKLLTALLKNPGMRASEAPLLTAEERETLLVAWNGKPMPHPGRSIAALFARQAAKTPDRTAFLFEEERITYRELDIRSSRLAHFLDSACGPGEETIGICLEHSLEVPVAVLGAIKSGRAFLMLPPALPDKRREILLEDCRIETIVTLEKWACLFSRDVLRRISLDADAAEINRRPDTPPDRELEPDSPLYVAYTSGSTGRPKGVRIPQRQALSFLGGRWADYPHAPDEVFCLKSDLGFVDAVTEIFEGLLQGAPTAIIGPETVRDAERLVRAIGAQGVTRTRFVPEHLSMVASSSPDLAQAWQRVRHIENTAAALGPHDLAVFMRALPHTRFVNVLGMSELVYATNTVLSPEDAAGKRVPVGRPGFNRLVYILDRMMQPVPPGVPGDLYLGGVDLPSGYINRPDESARRFISNPFRAGERLFVTGDLARWRPDGRIEHLGRRDHQLKIRGQRVEPGEIENQLVALPGIRQSAVQVLERNGRSLLAAYLVCEDGAPDGDAIRSELKKSLPEYMIPSFYITLDEIPHTASGKIDRNALPAPEAFQKRRELPRAERAQDEIETRIAGIWKTQLGLEAVGRSENFYALGGESLTAIGIRTRVQQVFKTRVPFSTFVEASTVAEQALLVRSDSSRTSNWQSLVPLRSGGDRPPLFFVPPVGATVMSFAHVIQYLDPEQPVYGLQPWGMDGEVQPHYLLPKMAADYIEKVRGISPEGPYLLVGSCFGGIVVFEMARQLKRAGLPVPLVAILDTQQPPNLTAGTRLKGLFNVLRSALISRNILPQQSARRILGRLTMGEWFDEDVMNIERVFLANSLSRFLYFSNRYDGTLHLFLAQGADRGARRKLWQKAARQTEVIPIPGEHAGKNSFMREPNVRDFAARLNVVIANIEYNTACTS